MTGYTCERCLKEFAQKSHYNTHMKRKTPCQNNKEKIKKEVEKRVNPELQNVIIEDTKNKEELTKKIETMIKNNDVFVESLNQLLHNHGIEFNTRLNIILELIQYKFNQTPVTLIEHSSQIYKEVLAIIENVSINKSEIFQKVFMFYGNKKSKVNLDQYYTPVTVGQFMNIMCIPGKKAIDPASGTGDLAINYDGHVTLWDISPDVIDIAKFNYELQHKTHEGSVEDSIIKHDKHANTYDYCFLNPPFGSSTVIQSPDILKNYELGKGTKKEEIGILFIERSLKLLKEGGVAYIILPNGYLGNNTANAVKLRSYLLRYRLIAIIELPGNTFSRSGTGVSTSLIIVSKTPTSGHYPIFIRKINDIGYQLNKKNTPYKYHTQHGEYVLNSNNEPMLLNHFVECELGLSKYLHDNHITCMQRLPLSSCASCTYEQLDTSVLDDRKILDVSRYLHAYTSILQQSLSEKRPQLKDHLQKNVKEGFVIDKQKEYIYLDIKQVNSPMYAKHNTMYGYELPGRAKIKVNKYDVIVSKLKGKITFAVILDDADNIVCTNGFCLLRPKSFEDCVILVGNLFSSEFRVQHNAMCTGSIMESISNDDIKNIYIRDNIDHEKYKNIMNALTVIHNEL
jgi:type I restriction enzyme M protein